MSEGAPRSRAPCGSARSGRGSGNDHARGSGNDHARGSGSDHARGTGSDHARGSGSDHARGSGSGSDHARGSGSDHARGGGSDHALGRGSGHDLDRRIVKNVLLDFGGTLDSDGAHWSTQLAVAFDEAGVRLERAALDRAFVEVDGELEHWPPIATCSLEEHAVEQARRMLLRLGRDEAPAASIGRSVAGRAEAHLRRSVELLAAARAGRDPLRFALVSNFTRNLERIVRDVGLDRVLDALVCSGAVGLRKPAPAIFRLALDRLGARAAQSAMIGDSLSADIAPARALGLMTIWLHGDAVFGGGDPSTADHEVASLAAALELCVRHGGGR